MKEKFARELPSARHLNSSLSLELGGTVEDLLPAVLLRPLSDLFDRPRKNLRGGLVEFGFRLGRGNRPSGQLDLCRQILESLHAGSLAIDDIEDGSLFRRGQPCLHHRYGVPVALNAGNWLYFWPAVQLQKLGLSPKRELFLSRAYHQTLLRAHVGQAIDVGVAIDRVDKKRIHSLCLANHELKSGALTGFAILLGAVAGNVEFGRLKKIEAFGVRFGVALQMLDDLGNLRGEKDPIKQWEDLRLRRPSWVWAALSKLKDAEKFVSFVTAVRELPNASALEAWLGQNKKITRSMTKQALDYLAALVDKTKSPGGFLRRDSASAKILDHLQTELEQAYGVK